MPAVPPAYQQVAKPESAIISGYIDSVGFLASNTRTSQIRPNRTDLRTMRNVEHNKVPSPTPTPPQPTLKNKVPQGTHLRVSVHVDLTLFMWRNYKRMLYAYHRRVSNSHSRTRRTSCFNVLRKQSAVLVYVCGMPGIPCKGARTKKKPSDNRRQSTRHGQTTAKKEESNTNLKI